VCNTGATSDTKAIPEENFCFGIALQNRFLCRSGFFIFVEIVAHRYSVVNGVTERVENAAFFL